MSIRRFYDRWPAYNQQVVETIRAMSTEELAIRPSPDRWPIWATVGHVAGVRIYWLCGVLGEPGAATTPFTEPLAETGWEDDESTPRPAPELVAALESTWRVVERCLDRWEPAMLDQVFERHYGGRRQEHTRGSVLQRLLSHDAYHAGELSLILGMHGLPQIDLWPRV